MVGRLTRGAGTAVALFALAATAHCGHGAPNAPGAGLLEAFPEAQALASSARPVEKTASGALLSTEPGDAWSSAALVAEIPLSAVEPTSIRVAGDPRSVRFTRLGALPGRVAIGSRRVEIASAAPGVDAVVFARAGSVEELFVVRNPDTPLGYRVALDAGWTAQTFDHGAALVDATGTPRLAVRATKAWDAAGNTLDVRTTVAGDEVRFAVVGHAVYPVVVDPDWSASFPPRKIRARHTTTLLGSGKLFIVGGSSSPDTTELLDPWTGKTEAGPAPLVARQGHSATMLFSGKVLVVGGDTDKSAELYDPIANTFSATGGLSTVRPRHSAVRLSNGKVLVVGGAAGATNDPNQDLTTELYDPQSGTFTAGPSRIAAKGYGALATLESGKVLFVSNDFFQTEAELYDPATSSWASAGSADPVGGMRRMTRLFDGRVAVHTLRAVASSGITYCESEVRFFSPLTGSFSDGAAFAGLSGRCEPSLVRLLDGKVLVGAGLFNPGDTSTSIFDPSGPSLAGDGATAAHHIESTATLLPGGDVILLGGQQATISRRVSVGTYRSVGSMARGRERHRTVRLHDGRALVTGGDLDPVPIGFPIAAEIYDPQSETFSATGDTAVYRVSHTATTLRSGKVLLAGGFAAGAGITSTELFDPAAPLGSRFALSGSLAQGRFRHTATLLPSGKVLLAGGCGAAASSDGDCTARLDTAEIYDPVAGSSTPVAGKMPAALVDHGAVLLLDGTVLLVDGVTAFLFDPRAGTFKATASPGAARDGRTARVLPNGKVFLGGGQTFAADLYDPLTATWSFSAPGFSSAPRMLWGALPDGRILSIGGVGLNGEVLSQQYVFDPIADPRGTFHQLTVPGNLRRYDTQLTLVGSGELLVSGGNTCFPASNCIGFPEPSARVHFDGAPKAARPAITQAPAKVTPGTRVTVTGTGFTAGGEASDGSTQASATNHPTLTWVSDLGDVVVPGTVVDFTDTTATWAVPPTAYHGHGFLFVSVGGMIGKGASVTIDAAPLAVGCTNDAQCGSGFCTDGVCCDKRCDGICEACSATKKGSGDDGVCGAVPPGKGSCVLSLGKPCTAGNECVTGFCAQGVCCDSSCTGECQSCNQATRPGLCSPINEGACGAACDGDHTLKKVGAPDEDCTPYKCEAQSCKTACASVQDCVAPSVCSLDGQCVPPPGAPPFDDGACGCRTAGAARGAASAILAALALAAGALRRLRRPS